MTDNLLIDKLKAMEYEVHGTSRRRAALKSDKT